MSATLWFLAVASIPSSCRTLSPLIQSAILLASVISFAAGVNVLPAIDIVSVVANSKSVPLMTLATVFAPFVVVPVPLIT